MSDSNHDPLAFPAGAADGQGFEPEREHTIRSHPVLAWGIICLMVGLVLAAHFAPHDQPAAQDRAELTSYVLLEIQGKFFVGAAELFRQVQPADAEFADHLKDLNEGSIGQRLRVVVLLGEMGGPAKALAALDKLDAEVAKAEFTLTPDDAQSEKDLRHLYGDFADEKLTAPSMSPAEREAFQHKFGWFGELALTPKGTKEIAAREAVLEPATRLAITFFAGIFVVMLAGFAGFIGLAAFLAAASFGQLRGGLSQGSGFGGIYLETFAVWMVLYFTVSLILPAIFAAPDAKLFVISLAQLSSLAALFWPSLRGVPWNVTRREIGLTLGRRPWLEPLLGPAAYAMMLPIMLVGVVITMVLVTIQLQLAGVVPENSFSPRELPSHPIINLVGEGGWLGRLQLLFLASVAAPVVEEIMFRGLLYRHLRDASTWFGYLGSVIFSATLTCFVFAVIHPQGPIAVPALMGVAYGLTFAREWRETLIPSMIAHGINNGIIMIILLIALG